MKARPQRSCISCRKVGRKGELIRLVNAPGGVVVDYTEKLPGRGAYICPAMTCIEGALRTSQLKRAFRQAVAEPDVQEFIARLRAAVARKVESLLGMARKANLTVMGFDAAADAARKSPEGLLIIAEDVSENTLRKLSESAGAAFRTAVRYGTKDGLGRTLGIAPVGVVFLSSSSMAEALKRELGRLSEISRG